jgi:hypothetical protein
MKNLIGFMFIMFVFTTQNALGYYTQCIDPKEDCPEKICKNHGGMKFQFPPRGDGPTAEKLGISAQYKACGKFLCVCNGD